MHPEVQRVGIGVIKAYKKYDENGGKNMDNHWRDVYYIHHGVCTNSAASATSGASRTNAFGWGRYFVGRGGSCLRGQKGVQQQKG